MDCGFNVSLKYVPIFSLPTASSDLSAFGEAAVNAGLWSSQVAEVDFYELVICQVFLSCVEFSVSPLASLSTAG